MQDHSGSSVGCSKECEYMFHECEADSTPAQECRAGYNECVAECDLE